jgi:hypothetical protein
MTGCRTDERDWRLFTSTVLLISSTSRIAREELDQLIMTGASSGSEVDELVRARSGVAGLELIAEYYGEGERP